MKRIVILVLLFSGSSFAQKSYEDLIRDLEVKGRADALDWSDMGELVDTIEAESADPEYRRNLCETTLLWLESLLPNTERVSRHSTANAGPLNIAILTHDVGAVVRNIVRGVHRSYKGRWAGPLHTVLLKPSKEKDPNALDALRAKVNKTFELEDRLHALRLLLLAGVKLNEQDDEGRTPLVLAVLDWPNFVPLLLAAGADPNVADDEGHGPLFHIVRAEKKGTSALNAMRKLIHSGAEINPIYAEGPTLLGHLAAHGRDDLVRELLDAGAHPWLLDKDGRTALHNAVITGAVEAVRVLLTHFASRADRFDYVNARDRFGMTPLMLAFSDLPEVLAGQTGAVGAMEEGVRKARYKIARMLIGAGAQSFTEAKTPLQLAIFYGSLNPVGLLPKWVVEGMSEQERMELMVLALGPIPHSLCTKQWRACELNLRHKRENIFKALWRAYEMDLSWEQLEMLESVASANGFDIVLEWLLELKAYPNPLTANQRWMLLRQLIRPLPLVTNRAEIENYRNARRRMFEMIVLEPGLILTPEQVEQIEELGEENGFSDFFMTRFWETFRARVREEALASPRPRRESAIPRLIRRVSKAFLSRVSPDGSVSLSPREEKEVEGGQTPKSSRNSSSGESSLDLTRLPKFDRDGKDGRGGGGMGTSTL